MRDPGELGILGNQNQPPPNVMLCEKGDFVLLYCVIFFIYCQDLPFFAFINEQIDDSKLL